MRRLLRMSLEGFKTFAGRTELELGPGMTAVVGPNGSGKSNLIDAIAWAVGSRSWKSLRGEGMEDVLFHGADGRAPAPLARVTLSFENEDRLLGIDFAEVVVTRELLRGGAGRLQLNGVEARVRDVQSVLSGTGLVGGFSLIRQGVVDKLILASPEELGRWVEESANIAGYRARKQEAVDRLRQVEAHAAEAERKNASLRRELAQVRERAARARRRRELEGRRDLLRNGLALLERRRLREALDAVDAESRRIRAELEARDAGRRDLAAARQRLEEELQAMAATPSVAPAEPSDDRATAGRIVRIRAAGGELLSIAERLAGEGPTGWPGAAARLEDVAGGLRGILGADEPAGAGRDRYRHCLAELRRCGGDLERLERERSEGAAELSGRVCERARLEERLAALGDAPPALELPEVVDPERARRELEELGRDLALLGSVDETAEDREREILRELDDLAPILQDLGATRQQLAGFIRQMEQVTSRLFRHTLASVEARFRRYFSILFQGGEARLEASAADGGPEEPSGAEAPGLAVRIKLPRKPETSLSLLSGGERSLSGLALVLALAAGSREEAAERGRLLVLDEVDAALDESNAARLALLLRELQHEHQILCVTHNRLTMHQASRLVGVAAGAASTSSLVKVEFARLEKGGSAA
jgi:chromosome segregation protein